MELQGGKHKALSTEDIADMLAKGLSVRSLAGPFDTHEQASQSLERYWDALMGDDD